LGSVGDREFVAQCMRGVDAVVHTATLHKPHIASHTRGQFIDTNITGTLNLLDAAVAAGVKSFVFTSTTSAFGRALSPPAGAPAAWITEEVVPQPKNIYGVTKLAAENLCELTWLTAGLPCIVLRTSRFFPENDDDAELRRAYEDANLKVNEFLYRRADIEDVVAAHLLGLEKAPAIGFARFIISATTPFARADLAQLRAAAPAVVKCRVPAYESEYQRRGWSMAPSIDRVYVNDLARSELGWRPRYDFASVLTCLIDERDFRSPLAKAIGSKGYHDKSSFERGSASPYPL
jgi:UDP-glucose 4-epimerase